MSDSQNTNVTNIEKAHFVNVSIAKTFDVEAPESATVKQNKDASHPRIPNETDYLFRKQYLRNVLGFLSVPNGDALWVFGRSGGGKTSLIEQVAARLHIPVFTQTASRNTTFEEFEGQFVMRSEKPGEAPSMSFEHGVLPQAMTEGGIMLINEADVMDPAELAGLLDIIEGKAHSIKANGGEIIKPHPDFRIVFCCNSSGSGDLTGRHPGIIPQNEALLDRCRFMEVDYPTKEEELPFLEKSTPALMPSGKHLLEKMWDVADIIRTLHEGSTVESMPNQTPLSINCSVRVLKRWAKLTVDMRGAPNAMDYAMDLAFLCRAPKEEQAAVKRICKDVFGPDLWKD